MKHDQPGKPYLDTWLATLAKMHVVVEETLARTPPAETAGDVPPVADVADVFGQLDRRLAELADCLQKTEAEVRAAVAAADADHAALEDWTVKMAAASDMLAKAAKGAV